MTRMLTALGAVLVLMAVAAPAAPAKQDQRPRSGPPVPGDVLDVEATASASGTGSTLTATASCPPGTKAGGGGFTAPSNGNVIALVYESVKVHQRAWRTSAQLLDLGEPSVVTLTTFAYCRSHLPGTETEAATVPTSGELQIGPTAEATCPPGLAAASGGFDMPAPLVFPTVTDLFFDSLRTGTSGWDTRVVTGPAGPSSVTSEVYCARRAGMPVEATGSSSPNGADFVPSTAVATCPADLTPLSGGFAQPQSGATSFFFITGSRRVGDSWHVSGLHAGNDPAVPLVAAAYCA